MRDIAILGAGGLAREVAFLIEDINRCENRWRIIGFVDRDASSVGKSVGKYTVALTEDQVSGIDCDLAIGIGNPQVLYGIRDRFSSQLRHRFPNLIHPSVVMDKARVHLGHGNVICAGVTMTTDILVGSVNVINLQCTIGHDVRIGDGCVLNPSANVSGNVTIEDGCLVGTGAQILQGLSVGSNAQVGAGAVVTKDVARGLTVMGIPARPFGGS